MPVRSLKRCNASSGSNRQGAPTGQVEGLLTLTTGNVVQKSEGRFQVHFLHFLRRAESLRQIQFVERDDWPFFGRARTHVDLNAMPAIERLSSNHELRNAATVMTKPGSRECADQSFETTDSSALLPVYGSPSDEWPSPQARALIGGRALRRQERGPRLDWARITGAALAIQINGLAVLYVSLPPSALSRAPDALEWIEGPRHALTVEFIEPVAIDPPQARNPTALVMPVPQHPSMHPLSKVATGTPQPASVSPAIPPPNVRWSLSESTTSDEVTPMPGAWRVPKSSLAVFQRQPAITYVPTRFADAWQPLSLADRARQATFSYARFCALSDEMKQIRGCSREERNADMAAGRGERVNIALRPDAAVE